MLGLPKTTEINRLLPKKSIYAKFKLNKAARDGFDADIRRLTIVNEVSPVTTNIPSGEEIKAFYVVLVSLKRVDFKEKNIALIARLIPQNLLFILECEGKAQLAVYRTKLMYTDWKLLEEHKVFLMGLDFDGIWQGIIVQVGDVTIAGSNTLDEQIAVDEKREKVLRRIEQLERQAWAEKQPKKKFELAQEVQHLKEKLEEKTNAKANT